jgi:hypothetical protein
MTRSAILAWHKGCGHKGQTVEKRRQNGPECNNGIRNRGLKQQLSRGSKEIFYEALKQTIGLKVVKGTVRSSVRIRKMSGRTLCKGWPSLKQKTRLLAA